MGIQEGTHLAGRTPGGSGGRRMGVGGGEGALGGEQGVGSSRVDRI